MATTRKTFIITGFGVTGVVSTDGYTIAGDGNISGSYTATQSQAQREITESGTIENIRVYAKTNTRSVATPVYIQLNGTNTAVVASVTASTTGWHEDTTHSVSVTAGDLVSIFIDFQAGSGSTEFYIIAFDFVSDIAQNTHMSYLSGGDSASTASSTRYQSGIGSLLSSTSESDVVKFRTPTTVTAKNMFARVLSNARSTDTTLRSRVSGANGNMVITVGAGQTGLFQDLSNSDTVANTDTFSYSRTTGTGTGSLSITMFGAEFHPSSGNRHVKCTKMTGTINTNVTRYAPIAGDWTLSGTVEADATITMRGSGTVRNISAVSPTNTAANATLITLRKNGADSSLVASITASTTGLFQDTTNSVTYADGDTLAVKISRASGSSGTCTPSHIMLEIEPDDEGGGGGGFNAAWARNSNFIICGGRA